MTNRKSEAQIFSNWNPSDYQLITGSLNLSSDFDLLQLEFQNTDIDSTTTPETLWDVGGTINWTTAAGATTLVSASANDAAAGTGARTVLVTGLDANRDIISETVTLNGVTPVNLTNNFFRVNSMTVVTAGSTGYNEGALTLQINDGVAKTASHMPAAFSRSSTGFYSVANSSQYQSGILIYESFSASRGGSGYCDVGIYRYRGGIRTLVFDTGLDFQGSSSFERSLFRSNIILEPGDDLEWRATATSANNVKAEGTAVLVLVNA